MQRNLFTTENAKEKGRKGGKKSGEVRRQKRDMKNFTRTFLEMGMKDGPLDDFNSLEDTKGKNLTVGESVVVALGVKALKGDKHAAELLFKFADLMPEQKINVEAEVAENIGYLDSIQNQLIDYRNASNFFQNEVKKDE